MQALSKFILRRNARMSLVQLAGQRELIGTWNIDSFIDSDDAWGWGEFDKVCFKELACIVDLYWNQSQKLAEQFLIGWEWDRVAIELRAVLRCAISESLSGTAISIIIKEYLEISRAFNDSPKELNFVRSVLHNYCQKQLSYNEIAK